MKKTQTINNKKLEDYKSQSIDSPLKIRGGSKRKTTINNKDQNGNIISTECDIYDDSLSGLDKFYPILTLSHAPKTKSRL